MLALVCALQANPSSAQQKTIVQTAIDAPGFNTLVAAVKAAGLVDTLNGHTEFTVFAPTDEAFAALPAGTLETLLKPENRQQLVDILTYHVVPGRVMAKDAFDLNFAKTVNGQRLAVDFNVDGLAINNSKIVASDIACRNGVIHVIDHVLLPSSDTIPAVATNAKSFNTLLAAVGAAGLGEVLSSTGPFTVFAPTDDAFAKLPAGTVENLLLPENKQKLIDILKYHVVAGRVYASDAVKAGMAPTLLGASVQVSVSAAGVKVNDSKIVKADIEAANGVIHVIDTVLLPTEKTPMEVRMQIQDAVSRGAAAFNAGDHGKCCDIYTQLMTSMMATGISGAESHLMTAIGDTLRTAEQTSNVTERAWALRRGLDSVYTQLGQMPMTQTIGN
jgi:uncharacterized surface protein with fasciclin (FAS1) repeats